MDPSKSSNIDLLWESTKEFFEYSRNPDRQQFDSVIKEVDEHQENSGSYINPEERSKKSPHLKIDNLRNINSLRIDTDSPQRTKSRKKKEVLDFSDSSYVEKVKWGSPTSNSKSIRSSKLKNVVPILAVSLVLLDDSEEIITITDRESVGLAILQFCLKMGTDDVALIEVLKRRIIREIQRIDRKRQPQADSKNQISKKTLSMKKKKKSSGMSLLKKAKRYRTPEHAVKTSELLKLKGSPKSKLVVEGELGLKNALPSKILKPKKSTPTTKYSIRANSKLIPSIKRAIQQELIAEIEKPDSQTEYEEKGTLTSKVYNIDTLEQEQSDGLTAPENKIFKINFMALKRLFERLLPAEESRHISARDINLESVSVRLLEALETVLFLIYREDRDFNFNDFVELIVENGLYDKIENVVCNPYSRFLELNTRNRMNEVLQQSLKQEPLSLNQH